MAAYPQGGLPETGVMIDVVHRPQIKTERRKYKRTLYWFGFIEILLGIAAFGTCVVGAVIVSTGFTESTESMRSSQSTRPTGSMLYATSGLWCGIVMIVSGILGVKVSKQSSLNVIRANMAASIISSIFMAIMFMMSMFASLSPFHTLLAIYVFLSIIASAGFILNIVHAAFCCATICCLQPHLDYRSVHSSTGRPPIVRYMLVDGQQLVPVGYPGPPPGVQPPALTPMMTRPVREDHRLKQYEPSTPPPAYTSRENINEGASTST